MFSALRLRRRRDCNLDASNSGQGLKGEGGRVEMLEMGVMNTIYDAISKEGFVNKLIIPLNDYLEMKVIRSHSWK